MGTRLLFGLVGQASDYTLAKVTFTGDSAAGHASLVTIAAEALGVADTDRVRSGESQGGWKNRAPAARAHRN